MAETIFNIAICLGIVATACLVGEIFSHFDRKGYVLNHILRALDRFFA